MLHHRRDQREDDDKQDDDVGNVPEDIGGDPDFEILERVDFLAVEETFAYHGKKQVANGNQNAVI